MAYGKNVELLSVAIDMQGSEVVKPYLQKENKTFVTVVDTENMFSREFGFKKIPNGYFIEPDGNVTYSKTWGFDIRSSEIRRKVEDWVKTSTNPEDAFESPVVEERNVQAEPYMESGLKLYQDGKKEAAVLQLRKALKLDPDNLTIRKQIWAIMNPDKFYGDEIDFDWQKQQFSAEGLHK
jgi:hypothetical protein